MTKVGQICCLLSTLFSVNQFFYSNLGGGWGVILPPCWFSLNNSETVKAVTLAFCSISNISVETFVSNFVSLTCPSLEILGKTQIGVFPISRFLVNPLWKKTVITPEPVMILTWNLDQKLNLMRETKQRQKIWWWHHVGKLWRQCHFSNLWPIWCNLEAGFWLHSL